MAENKTRATAASVDDFLDSVPDSQRRADGKALRALMERVSGERPAMWGPSIVGFGTYHYKYESGREGDMCRIGFSPRSTWLVLYGGFLRSPELLARLGKHKTGKGCLYIRRLADVDEGVLEQMAVAALDKSCTWQALSTFFVIPDMIRDPSTSRSRDLERRVHGC